MKIAVIGHCGVGKTNLIKRLMESDLKEVIIANPKLKEISSIDLNPEYNKLVNENFWGLI